MSRRFELEIPQTLTDEEARLVIEVLEELIEVLCRQVHHLDKKVRSPDDGWIDPHWMDDDEPD